MKTVKNTIKLLGLLATIAFASCSSDDGMTVDPTVNPTLVPTPTMTTLLGQRPLKTLTDRDDVVLLGANWNDDMAYRGTIIRPTKAGNITHVGVKTKIPGTVEILIKEVNSDKIVVQTNATTSTTGFEYTKLWAPVSLVQGRKYVIAVKSDNFYRFDAKIGGQNILPRTVGKVEVLSTVAPFYTAGEHVNTNVSYYKKEVRGLADFIFVPNS